MLRPTFSSEIHHFSPEDKVLKFNRIEEIECVAAKRLASVVQSALLKATKKLRDEHNIGFKPMYATRTYASLISG
jgi:hypothetical protein